MVSQKSGHQHGSSAFIHSSLGGSDSRGSGTTIVVIGSPVLGSINWLWSSEDFFCVPNSESVHTFYVPFVIIVFIAFPLKPERRVY